MRHYGSVCKPGKPGTTGSTTRHQGGKTGGAGLAQPKPPTPGNSVGLSAYSRDEANNAAQMLLGRFRDRAEGVERAHGVRLFLKLIDVTGKHGIGGMKEWWKTSDGQKAAAYVERHDLVSESFAGTELVRVAREVFSVA